MKGASRAQPMKTQWEHFPNAPITEALIDIRVVLPLTTTFGTLAGFREALAERFPKCRQRWKLQGQFTFRADRPPAMDSGSQEPDGYLLASPDGTQVVQARLDGFTFSQLKPYDTWDALKQAAQDLWRTYVDIAKPGQVERIAVRYINRIELPAPVTELSDWILTAPAVSPNLPQTLAGFFVRLNIPFDNPPCFVNLTQTVELGESGATVPLIFDIDAFTPARLDPKDEALWRRFEDLRTVKNKVFFDSLTPRTKELFR